MSFDEVKNKMDASVSNFQKELSGLRTGRASVNLLDSVRVDVYGSTLPLNQAATVSCPEARMLTVQVWDRGLVKAVEKAIVDANLGLNPAADGQLIRVPIPQLSEERRREISKIAAKYAESARVAIRNTRRDALADLKKLEKDGDLSEDDLKRQSQEIQKITDDHTKKIDDLLTVKQKEFMQV